MKNQNKKNQNRKGFTLIELIVVIAILAILAAVAIPNFMGLTRKAEIATEVAAATEYVNAINVHNALAKGDSTLDDLAPQLDTSITDTNITGRIDFDAKGMAFVSEKGELS